MAASELKNSTVAEDGVLVFNKKSDKKVRGILTSLVFSGNSAPF